MRTRVDVYFPNELAMKIDGEKKTIFILLAGHKSKGFAAVWRNIRRIFRSSVVAGFLFGNLITFTRGNLRKKVSQIRVYVRRSNRNDEK